MAVLRRKNNADQAAPSGARSDGDGQTAVADKPATTDETLSANGSAAPAEKPAAQERTVEQKPAEDAPAAEQQPAEKKKSVEQRKAEAKQAAKDKAAAEQEQPKKKGSAGKKAVATVNAVRSRIASIVWLVAVAAAAVLAIGALLLALKMDRDNAIVAFFVNTAKGIDLGHFKDFTGKGASIKEHLVDWGIAAVIYLVVGKVLDKIIRP